MGVLSRNNTAGTYTNNSTIPRHKTYATRAYEGLSFWRFEMNWKTRTRGETHCFFAWLSRSLFCTHSRRAISRSGLSSTSFDLARVLAEKKEVHGGAEEKKKRENKNKNTCPVLFLEWTFETVVARKLDDALNIHLALFSEKPVAVRVNEYFD